MRIIVTCHNYPPHPGGLEVVVRSLVREFGRRHEVLLITSAWDGASGRSEEDGIVVHRLPAIHASEPLGVPYPVPWGAGARAALREAGRPDVIHAHGTLYALSVRAALLARRRDRPLILTEHVGFVQYASGLVNAVQRAAWGSVGRFVGDSADAFTVLNTRVRDMLAARWPRKPIELIRNGVDAETFRPRPTSERLEARRGLGLPADATLVLFVGRDVAKKNLADVLRIPRSGFQLVLCGARRDVHADGVIDLGVLPHERMPDLVAAVDIMVHASTGEGFPVAVQEAMASGVPLAVLWDPGYASTLDRDIVEAVDSVAGLGGAVRRLVQDPERRAALAEAGRSWALRMWSWSAACARYEDLFERARRARQGTQRHEPGGRNVAS